MSRTIETRQIAEVLGYVQCTLMQTHKPIIVLSVNFSIINFWLHLQLQSNSCHAIVRSYLSGSLQIVLWTLCRLKVRQSRKKQILVPSILPKNKLWDNFMYWKNVRFLGRIEDTIKCFRDLLTFIRSKAFLDLVISRELGRFRNITRWLRSIMFFSGKVRTFWETHKIWKNLPHGFDKSADLLSKRQNHEEDFFKLCETF